MSYSKGMALQAALFHHDQALDRARARLRAYTPSPEYVAYRKREKEALDKALKVKRG